MLGYFYFDNIKPEPNEAVASGQFLAEQLALTQPGGADYTYQLQYYEPPGFSDLATAPSGLTQAGGLWQIS